MGFDLRTEVPLDGLFAWLAHAAALVSVVAWLPIYCLRARRRGATNNRKVLLGVIAGLCIVVTTDIVYPYALTYALP